MMGIDDWSCGAEEGCIYTSKTSKVVRLGRNEFYVRAATSEISTNDIIVGQRARNGERIGSLDM